MTNFTELGKIIKRERTKVDLKLRELAKNAEITPGYLSQLENGKIDNAPSKEMIKRLVEALTTDPRERDRIESEMMFAVEKLPVDIEREAVEMLRAKNMTGQDLITALRSVKKKMTDQKSKELPVTWLAKDVIERKMIHFIQKYQSWSGVNQLERCEGVHPIEYLKYLHKQNLINDFGFLDLSEEYDCDALGLCDFSNNAIYLDYRLDDGGEFEAKRSFTAAHELAHWIIHRPIYLALTQTNQMFESDNSFSAYRVVCRNSIVGQYASARTNQSMMEWQADYGAACLLLPSELVLKQYKAFIDTHKATTRKQDIQSISGILATAEIFHKLVPPLNLDPVLYNGFINYTTALFHCSRKTAEIRIRELKLL